MIITWAMATMSLSLCMYSSDTLRSERTTCPWDKIMTGDWLPYEITHLGDFQDDWQPY